jgi:tetratricopeptide (TPR) repeat protein
MRFHNLKLCLALFLIPLSAGFAASPEGFETGNGLYGQGKFKEARQAYESTLATGNYSANLFYNLANANFRLGDPGLAALNYERALALEPSHPEARANLSFVRAQTGAKTTPHSWQDIFFIEFSPNVYAMLAAIAGWVALFCFAAAFFRTSRQGLILVAVCACLVSAYSIAAIRFLEKDSSFALVTAKRSDARFEPMESATLAETLPAGSHVRVLTRSGAWAYCDLPNGNRAWLPNETIESLQPTRS